MGFHPGHGGSWCHGPTGSPGWGRHSSSRAPPGDLGPGCPGLRRGRNSGSRENVQSGPRTGLRARPQPSPSLDPLQQPPAGLPAPQPRSGGSRTWWRGSQAFRMEPPPLRKAGSRQEDGFGGPPGGVAATGMVPNLRRSNSSLCRNRRPQFLNNCEKVGSGLPVPGALAEHPQREGMRPGWGHQTRKAL